MRILELLQEIDYASGIPPLNVDISNAKQVGIIDNNIIWLIGDSTVEIYSFISGKQIVAYVAVSAGEYSGYRRLLRLENIMAAKGSITALVSWIISKLNYKLQLSSDEELTQQGLKWISNLIMAGGRGLKITDQTGKIPDIKELHKEWDNARQNYLAGPTSVYIENKNIKLKSINENNLLSPCMKFIGDDTID